MPSLLNIVISQSIVFLNVRGEVQKNIDVHKKAMKMSNHNNDDGNAKITKIELYMQEKKRSRNNEFRFLFTTQGTAKHLKNSTKETAFVLIIKNTYYKQMSR